MASQEIGSLFVSLGLDSAVFTAGVQRIQGVTGKLQKSFNGIADRAEAMGARLSVVSGVMAGVALAATGMVKGTAAAASEISRQSAIANASTEEFQRMAAGAKTVGIEQDKLADILKDVNDRVGDFNATGGGPMADFFENVAPKVGITADAFKDLSGPQALQLYVSSLEKAGLSQQDMTFYLEAMASDATALIPLLKNGGAEMTRFGDAAAASGAIMSTELLAGSKAFNDRMRTLMGALDGVKNRLAEALLPLVNRFIDALITYGVPALNAMVGALENLIQWFGNLSEPVQLAAAAIATALGTSGPILLAIAGLSRALALLMTPAGGIGLLIGAAAAIYLNWEGISAFFTGIWDTVSAKAAAAWAAVDQTMNQALAAIQQKQTQIEQFFVQGWERILAFLRTLPAKFIEIGGQIIDGLKAGIEAKWNAMVSWFTDKADQLVADFKSIFDIQSPSRVFRGIGQFITEGLQLGLEDGVGGVQASMQGVADAVGLDGAEGGLFKFRDSARDVFSQVAFEGGKLSDVLRSKLSNFAGQQASKFFTSGFNGLWGALGLPSFANGTNDFAGGLARINERGGEIVDLPSGTRVIPNDISKRMADRSTPGALDVQVHVTAGFDESGNLYVKDVAQKVAAQAVKSGSAAAMADYQKRKAR